jgi:hypothetical protein
MRGYSVTVPSHSLVVFGTLHATGLSKIGVPRQGCPPVSTNSCLIDVAHRCPLKVAVLIGVMR